MFNLFNGSKKITEKLYEQNLELAVKNKTLSLLEKLYQNSVLNLTPREITKEITIIPQNGLKLIRGLSTGFNTASKNVIIP